MFVRALARTNRDVAQLGSAPDWGSGGRRFESCHPDHFDRRNGPDLNPGRFSLGQGYNVLHMSSAQPIIDVTATVSEPVPSWERSPEDRRIGAAHIVHRYVAMSAIVGSLPFPGLDSVMLGGVHLALIKELTEHYGFKFQDKIARNVIIAVGLSVIPAATGSVITRRLLMGVPFFARALTMGTVSAGVSFAIGTLLTKHYEAGGTLASVNVDDLHAVRFARVVSTPKPATA